jgi:hypothetical protein
MPILSAFGAASARGFNPQSLAPIVEGEYSYLFNGTNEYLWIDNNNSLAPTSRWVVEMFINVSSLPSEDKTLFNVGLEQETYYLGTFEILLSSIGAIKLRRSTLSSFQTLTTSNSITTNTWVYIAVSGGTSSADNGVKMWINGTEGYSDTTFRNWRTTLSTDVFIGRNNSTSPKYFGGRISNLRYRTGVAITTAPVPTSPLTNVSNTKLLTCQSSTIVDNSTANSGGPWTINDVNSVGISPTSPFYP